jgi:NAD(P)-dependent dehydrogenase (short-subunit alcohol dehydrogenase family)
MVNFDNETIIVIGGSSGIGESLVKLITARSQKAKVIVIDIVAPKPTCKCHELCPWQHKRY